MIVLRTGNGWIKTYVAMPYAPTYFYYKSILELLYNWYTCMSVNKELIRSHCNVSENKS